MAEDLTLLRISGSHFTEHFARRAGQLLIPQSDYLDNPWVLVPSNTALARAEDLDAGGITSPMVSAKYIPKLVKALLPNAMNVTLLAREYEVELSDLQNEPPLPIGLEFFRCKEKMFLCGNLSRDKFNSLTEYFLAIRSYYYEAIMIAGEMPTHEDICKGDYCRDSFFLIQPAFDRESFLVSNVYSFGKC